VDRVAGAWSREDEVLQGLLRTAVLLVDTHLVSLRCSAAIFRGDTVLLCRRMEDSSPTWVLPGGTPREGEGATHCVRREVLEETGLVIDTSRVAFVLETKSPDRVEHRIEIVFMALLADLAVEPVPGEDHLAPQFVKLDRLSSMKMLPPISGYLRGLADKLSRVPQPADATAPYLGNLWRADGASSGAAEREP
jgi:8-oxo-dGTP diphosphatase